MSILPAIGVENKGEKNMSSQLSREDAMKENPGLIMRSIQIKIKQVPMQILEIPANNEMQVPDFMRYTGADPKLKEVFIPLQIHLGTEADILKVKANPPTEGAFYKDVLLVPSKYLSKTFPERENDIRIAKAFIIHKFMTVLPAAGKA